MLERHILADVQTYLMHFPSLLITGARQVGKSIIERDLHDVGNIGNLDNFMRLYLLLALHSA